MGIPGDQDDLFDTIQHSIKSLSEAGLQYIVCIKCLVYYTPQGEHQHSLWAKFYGLMWGKMMWLILKIPTINRISRRFFVHFNSNSSSTQMNARFRRSRPFILYKVKNKYLDMTKMKTEACFWIKGFAILISVLIVMLAIDTLLNRK
ncbi:hypothetical protein CHUAL_013472 [Chamberlinius hualienensis]